MTTCEPSSQPNAASPSLNAANERLFDSREPVCSQPISTGYSPVSPRLAARPRPRRTVASVVFVARSFNHLIRPPEHRRGDGQTEGFGGLQVDDQLKLGGLLDGEIGWLGALEDLIYVCRRLPIQVAQDGAIRHQTPRLYVFIPRED